jgi:hypothetical protein
MGWVRISGEPATDGPIVTAVNPNQGALEQLLEAVEVTGLNFQNGAEVKLVKNDDPSVVIQAENEITTGTTLITCDIDLDSYYTDAEVGVYDVVVTNPDLKEGQLDDGFEVVEYPCAPNIWGDDFESYPVGTYPTNGWVNFWSGASGYVTDEQAYSGTKSFRLQAYPYWARYDGYPFTSAGHTYVCYEMRVMITDPTKRAIMGFAWKTSPSTTGHYAAISICAPNYPETYRWYHVLAKINMVDNTWDLWVDGEKIKDGASCGDSVSHDSFTHFFVGLGNFSTGGTSVGYYDDVYLYWDD